MFQVVDKSVASAYEKEIKNISLIIAEATSKAGKKTIAVVDFTDLQGNITELGRFLAEELSVDLTTSATGFDVIDRTHLKSILAEHALSVSGLINPKTIKQLGQMAGVDAIITGSVTPFGDSIRATVKVIATDTARVIGAAKGDIAKTKAIEELLARGIESGRPSVQPTSTISYVSSAGANNPHSKTVGDIVITVKRIVISSDQVNVILDLFNRSAKKLELACSRNEPDLVDEKGNVFFYRGGLKTRTLYSWGAAHFPTLNPKSNNDLSLVFRPRANVKTKDIGSDFTFSLEYVLYDPNDKSELKHNVSFTDIPAQRPQ